MVVVKSVFTVSNSPSVFLCIVLYSVVQMDSAVEEVFLNVTPLHRAERDIQSELNKLQASVRDKEMQRKECNETYLVLIQKESHQKITI